MAALELGRKWGWRILFVLVPAATLCILVLLSTRGVDIAASGTQGQAASIPDGFKVRGRLEPKDELITLGGFSPAANIVIGDMYVEAGQHVSKGDILASLGNHAQAAAEVHAAEAELALAERRLTQTLKPYRQAQLDALTAAIEARKADLELAQRQMRRTEDLAPGVRTTADREKDQAALRSAEARLREAEATREALRDIGEPEIAVAQAQIDLARAKLGARKADQDLTLIRAPRAGTVLKIYARPGEVATGRAILDLADMDQIKAVAEVDERLAPRVKVGEQARIAIRGSSREWNAVVVRVGSLVRSASRLPIDAATGRGGRFVDVDLAIPDHDSIPRIVGLELTVQFLER